MVIGAVVSYLLTRRKNIAEVDKLKAEAEKARAETERIRLEMKTATTFVEPEKVLNTEKAEAADDVEIDEKELSSDTAAAAYYLRGISYHGRKDHDQAIVAFSRAIQLDSNQANTS